MTARVAVVGGGITGLAAAWELLRSGADVTVQESSTRLGGKILTDEMGGRLIDLGPDAFVARTSEAMQLCHELRLEDELVTAATDHAAILVGGRLRPLPRDILLGVPSRLTSVARSRILSPRAVARVALDGLLPGRRDKTNGASDVSVGDLVTARLGRQVHDRLVDPLFGGIHAGPSRTLSVQATAPQLAAAASARRLMRGVRSQQRGRAEKPSFHTLRSGLGRLVDRLVEELRSGGVTIRLQAPVDSVPVEGFDATVVTTPAHVTARLVDAASPEAGAALRAIDYASVTLTVLTYPESAFPKPPHGSGFLVPHGDDHLITACSFASSKWPHWAAPGEVVLRLSAGRFGDGRAMEMEDVELVQRQHNELVEVMKLTEAPMRARVTRWVDALPQYRVGHLQQVATIESALRCDAPSVEVAGAAYRGLGITTCVAQGRAAAQRALASFRASGRAAATRTLDFDDVDYVDVPQRSGGSAWAAVGLRQEEPEDEEPPDTQLVTSWPIPDDLDVDGDIDAPDGDTDAADGDVDGDEP